MAPDFTSREALRADRVLQVETSVNLKAFAGLVRVNDLADEVLRAAVRVMAPNQRDGGAGLDLRDGREEGASHHAVALPVDVPERGRERDHLPLGEGGGGDVDVLVPHLGSLLLKQVP
jgi:hypothetical protein